MLRINYHHLYLFWTFSQEGTFTKTSEKLSIAQSAVTSQIMQLEKALGLTLIDRSNKRKPVLTEDGKLVLDFAISIFETGEELVKWATHGSQSKSQVLRLGALSGLSRNFQYEFLKPMLGKSDFRIEVTTGDQDKLVKMLKEHSLDLILSSHNVRSDGRIPLYSHVLKSTPIVFVISKVQKKKGYELKDYFRERHLCLPSRNFEYRPEIDAFLERIPGGKNIVAEIDDIALLRISALKSDAVVAIPEMGVLNELRSGEIQIISRPKGLEQKFYAISRQKRLKNPVADALISRMMT